MVVPNTYKMTKRCIFSAANNCVEAPGIPGDDPTSKHLPNKAKAISAELLELNVNVNQSP